MNDQSKLTHSAEQLLDEMGLGTRRDRALTRPRLTVTDIALAYQLREEGKTQVVIAQRLGVDQSTISRLLQSFEDRTPLAKAYARGRAFTVVRRLERFGQKRDKVGLDALRTLANIGQMMERGHTASGTLNINVGVALPGTPQFEQPAIEARVISVDDGSECGR